MGKKKNIKQKAYVVIDHNYLSIQFTHEGQTIREYLGKKHTPANYRSAAALAKEITKELNRGSFFYTEYFDNPERAALFEEEVDSSKIIFKDYAMEWLHDQLDDVEQGERKLTGVKKDEQSINKYILPVFGKMSLDAITSKHVKKFTNSLKHLSQKTRKNHLTPLRQIMNAAIEDELIDRSPVPERIRNKRTKKEKQEQYKKKLDNQPFSSEDILRILKHIQKYHPDKAIFFAVLFYTGMRIQEALAMKWEYLNKDKWTYHILEAVSGGRIEEPKTESSIRTIRIIKPLRDFFIEQEQYSRNKSEYILVTNYGKRFRKQSHLINKIFYPTLDALGIKRKELKYARHVFTTLSLELGEKKSDIRKNLGHTTNKMIDDHYMLYVNNPNDNDHETEFEKHLIHSISNTESEFTKQ